MIAASERTVMAGRPLALDERKRARVLAFIPAYNEFDFLKWTLKKLVDQGVTPYVIDNWSTDGSYEFAVQEYGYFMTERFPAAGPTGTYDWADILGRIGELSDRFADRRYRYNWMMLNDADEIRRPPREWSAWCSGLSEAFAHVSDEGYNAVEFEVLNFQPVDEGWNEWRDDPEDYFKHREFVWKWAGLHQVKAWASGPVNLAESGGHLVRRLDGKPTKLYPMKFLSKHYPFRNQAQAERKVFRDRKDRWNQAERKKGWHVHYDKLEPGYSFLRHPDVLVKEEE